jgi:3-hydroxyacyl-[acyl-carrier-protein] dehydratase
MAMKPLFRHRFDSVDDYLHHRPPYLLVHEITDIQDRSIRTRHVVDEDAFFIKGHFPGAPIMPGAMMQELSTQSAGVLIAANFNPMKNYNTHDPFFNEYALGVLVKVKQARYRGFVRPGDRLDVLVNVVEQIGEVFDFACTIRCDETVVMQNHFQLVNIKSETLQGKDQT